MKLHEVVVNASRNGKVAFKTEPPLSEKVFLKFRELFGTQMPDVSMNGSLLLVPVSMTTLTGGNCRQCSKCIEQQLSAAEKIADAEVPKMEKEGAFLETGPVEI